MFSGGAVTGIQHNMPKLDLEALRIEAAVANAGTAVTMNYTGGSGTPPLGPSWSDVLICPATEVTTAGGPGFNIGVRGTNVRDLFFERVHVAGAFNAASHPFNPTMTEAFYFDGEDDPVELHFRDCYFYYLDQAIRVGGKYEGVYLDGCTTVAIRHFLKWHANGPQPTLHAHGNYVGSERSAFDLDMLSYFDISGNTINPTAPVPNANYTGVIVRRTSLDQTQVSKIHNNLIVGVGYSTSSGGTYTETGVDLVNANTVEVVDNTIYDMDVGVKGTAGAANRIRNRYINCTTNESVPVAMRTCETRPEIMVRAAVNAIQSVPVSTDTVVAFAQEDYDNSGVWASNRFSPPTGYYHVDARVFLNTNMAVGDVVNLAIRKNGTTTLISNPLVCSKAMVAPGAVSGVVEISSGDYVEVVITIEGTGSNREIRNLASQCYFHARAIS